MDQFNQQNIVFFPVNFLILPCTIVYLITNPIVYPSVYESDNQSDIPNKKLFEKIKSKERRKLKRLRKDDDDKLVFDE